MKYLIRIVFISVALTACTQTGRDFNQNKASEFVKGQTTYSEVVQALGPPSSTTKRSDGTTHISYLHMKTDVSKMFIPIVGPFLNNSTRTDMKTMYLWFDKDNILLDWSSTQRSQ